MYSRVAVMDDEADAERKVRPAIAAPAELVIPESSLFFDDDEFIRTQEELWNQLASSCSTAKITADKLQEESKPSALLRDAPDGGGGRGAVYSHVHVSAAAAFLPNHPPPPADMVSIAGDNRKTNKNNCDEEHDKVNKEKDEQHDELLTTLLGDAALIEEQRRILNEFETTRRKKIHGVSSSVACPVQKGSPGTSTTKKSSFSSWSSSGGTSSTTAKETTTNNSFPPFSSPLEDYCPPSPPGPTILRDSTSSCCRFSRSRPSSSLVSTISPWSSNSREFSSTSENDRHVVEEQTEGGGTSFTPEQQEQEQPGRGSFNDNLSSHSPNGGRVASTRPICPPAACVAVERTDSSASFPLAGSVGGNGANRTNHGGRGVPTRIDGVEAAKTPVKTCHEDDKEMRLGGHKLRVKGTRHVYDSISNGSARIVQCSSCQAILQVGCSAKLVYCISCQQVTPMEVARNVLGGRIGATDGDIAKSLQVQEVNAACRRKAATATTASNSQV